MNTAPDVSDRTALPAGKVFIKAGEECERAYIIQVGEVVAFTLNDGEKVEVGRFGPGTLIGELCLLIDEPITLSYEAVVTTTVITITRQDFQKRLSKVDKTVRSILDHAAKKIRDYEREETHKAIRRSEIDDTAFALVHALCAGLAEEKKQKYTNAMLPHLNGLIKEIKEIKAEAKKNTG